MDEHAWTVDERAGSETGGPSTYSAPPAVGASSVVHAAHAAGRVAGRVPLWFIDDDDRGGEEQRCDRRGVLQRRAGDLGRVDDPILDQVDVFPGGAVELP